MTSRVVPGNCGVPLIRPVAESRVTPLGSALRGVRLAGGAIGQRRLAGAIGQRRGGDGKTGRDRDVELRLAYGAPKVTDRGQESIGPRNGGQARQEAGGVQTPSGWQRSDHNVKGQRRRAPLGGERKNVRGSYSPVGKRRGRRDGRRSVHRKSKKLQVS